MREGFREAGLTVYGGVNSPYLWLKAPEGMTSWEFFDHLLHEMNVVGTPGSGFGPSGEGYLRLTASVSVKIVWKPWSGSAGKDFHLPGKARSEEGHSSEE